MRTVGEGKVLVAVMAEGTCEEIREVRAEMLEGFIEGVELGASFYGAGSIYVVREEEVSGILDPEERAEAAGSLASWYEADVDDEGEE